MFNAHCHLELGHLKGRIPPGLPFVEWLEKIVHLKRALSAEDSRDAAFAGIRRLRETGTNVLFDILSLETSELAIRNALRHESSVRAILFWEVINFIPSSGEWAVDRAVTRQHFEGPLPQGSLHALSPHAPYTTTRELLEAAAERSRKEHQWLCIHAAESTEETQMMLHGTGPLREFLSAVLLSDWEPPRLRPIEYLSECGCLTPLTLLVHCNDITDSDVELIRKSGASVVVCPGTHVYFDRGPFPLEKLWAAGVPVYLGTDSLASNEDLDMSREVGIAKQLCPRMPPEVIESLVVEERAWRFFEPIKL